MLKVQCTCRCVDSHHLLARKPQQPQPCSNVGVGLPRTFGPSVAVLELEEPPDAVLVSDTVSDEVFLPAPAYMNEIGVFIMDPHMKTYLHGQ